MIVAGVLGVLVAGGAFLVGVPLVVGVGLSGSGRAAPAGAASGVTSADGVGPGADGIGPEVVAGIPAAYLADFEVSGARFGVPWSVLAGIYKLECDFGQSGLPGCPRGTENAFGAQGPGQFLASTWRRGLRAGEIIPLGPPTVTTADGFATDGDGDGLADPWDPADAVASTARMLSANGAASDIRGAVFSYNHDPTYVQQVLGLAAGYQAAAGADAAPRGPSDPVAAEVSFAEAQLGKPYQWGGAGPATWDCSGLVQAALGGEGLVLPHDAAAQYADTASGRVPLTALEPGDLVFYGTSPATIHHVGIYVGGGDMIDAPYTGAVVRFDPIAARDLLTATRPFGPGGLPTGP